ncbi:adenosylmethionine decarboxylase [Sneathiella sp. DP05]|uniref:S-adenosylmethionine decarboxylase proenzyme n=2 Tax=Sneathiella litorea TaxID=2606216 RepID=A0A6L8W6U5_9PROT|nr:adenosylmethionine decarboxylase [Sneathiella litorea]
MAQREAFAGIMLENENMTIAPGAAEDDRLDYFVHKDGLTFAGTHLIIDLWGGEGLNDADLIETTLRRAIDVAGATLLHFHIHAFEPDGLSGVAVLAESHISFHSWPERDYMALDIFMCGKTDPYKAIPILREAFKPETLQLNEIKRGIVS